MARGRRKVELTPDQIAIKKWIRDKLDEDPTRRKWSQGGLGRALQLNVSGSNALVQGPRRIQMHELPIIERYFDARLPDVIRRALPMADDADSIGIVKTDADPPIIEGKPDATVTEVRVSGRVSEIDWYVEDSFEAMDLDAVPLLQRDRYAIEDQVALEISPSLSRRYPELGSYVIAVPAERYRPVPYPGDRFLLRVRRDELIGWRYLICALVDGRATMVDGAGRPSSEKPELLIVQAVIRFD